MTPFKKLSANLARSRLPYYFSLVVLLVVAMLALPIYWMYAEKLRTQISYVNDSLIGQVQSAFDGMLQEIDRTSIRLAENAGLTRFVFMDNNGLFEDEQSYQLSLKELRGIIANEEKFNANIGNIYIYLPRTDVIVTSDSTLALSSFSDRDYVAKIARGEQPEVWSGVRASHAKRVGGYPAREDVVTLHRHLTKDGLVNDATLFIDVKMSLFKETDRYRSAAPLRLIVTDSDGSLIFAGPGSADPVNIVDTIRSDARSNYNDWNYTIVLSKQWLYEPMQDINRWTVGVAVSVLAVGLLVSLYFSRRFHRPLEAALSRWRRAGASTRRPSDDGTKGNSLQESLHSLVDSTLSYADLVDANKATIKNALLLELLQRNEWPQPDALIGMDVARGRSFYQVVSCTRDAVADLNERDKGIIRYAALHLAKEAFEETGAACGFEVVGIDDDAFGILVYGAAEGRPSLADAELGALLDRLHELLRLYPQFTWTTGIGNRYADDAFVSRSYRESQLAVQYRIYRGKGGAIRFSELQAADNGLTPSSDEWKKYKDKALAGIRSRDLASTRAAVTELCEWMLRAPGIRSGRTRLNGIYYIGFSVFTEIEKLIYDLNMDRVSIYPNDRSFARLIESDPTVVDIRDLLLDTCERMIGYLNDKPTTGKSSFVASIVDYIRDAYMEQQISLESTAARFGMNPSYLGQLLKKELNRTFLQVLSEARIEQAKRLLADPTVQIQDVADRVGYGNRSTFIRMFKSYAGLTPSEFRNRTLLEAREITPLKQEG